MATFLDIPAREAKPRAEGLTVVLDRGISKMEAESLVEIASEFVDIVKLGWGTAYVTGPIAEKVATYLGSGIPVMLGGTLGEVAQAQGKMDQFIEWVGELGLSHIEISDGAIELPRERKLALIEQLSARFTVLSEVGSKDPEALVAPFRWVQEIKEELAAGAKWVVLEARESGTAGVFRPSGEIRMGLIEEIEQDIDPKKLIFEAPRKSQQTWFINRFGPNVNLGNIAPADVIGLETLRLGLRADTLGIGS